MIIINLKGGLGNQMFQYALGRHLSEIHQCPLKMNLDILKLYLNNPLITRRKYELGCFKIIEDFEIPQTKSDLFKCQIINVLSDFFYVKKVKQPKLIPEEGLSFQPKIFHQKPPLILQGYWQSELYFKSIENIIREEFTLKTPLSQQAKELQQKIQHCNAIGIHIRRGDYLTNPNSKKFHGVCSMEYYQKAMDMMADKVENLTFFVFSDEPDWVLQNFKTNYTCHIIQHRADQHSYEDLFLMKACKHQIIANSTYSWWAAWLNDYPEKIVIAPQKWLLDEIVDTKDIIPQTWVKI